MEPAICAPKKTAHGAFKAYEPGYLHMDAKYLPQMAEEDPRRYLFVATTCRQRSFPTRCGKAFTDRKQKARMVRDRTARVRPALRQTRHRLAPPDAAAVERHSRKFQWPDRGCSAEPSLLHRRGPRTGAFALPLQQPTPEIGLEWTILNHRPQGLENPKAGAGAVPQACLQSSGM